MPSPLKTLKALFSRVDSRTIYFYSFLIGIGTGLVAILFHHSVHLLHHWLFSDLARFSLTQSPSILQYFPWGEGAPRYLWVLLLPALGGLAVGLCTHYFGPEAEGTGIDQLLQSFHQHGGQLRRRTPWLRLLTSTLTLSTGGSTGKEGPMALIGGGIGSNIARLLRMGARAQRTLLLAGSAGGLGAIFRAPLGGAITAVEVLYKEDFESDALLPCIISSVTAYTLYCSVLGFGHQIQFHTETFSSPIEMFFYVLLALFCAGAGYIFIRLFRGMREKFFLRLPFSSILRPAFGGLLVGGIGLLLPQAIGEGTGVLQSILNGHYPETWMKAAFFFLTLAAVKMLATACTVQSGGSGGALIPSLFIGAMLGGFFGVVAHHFFPNQVTDFTPYMVVGMAAFFSSVTNASLGALVMVTELTGGYELLPPLMIVAVVSLITTHKWSLYRYQVDNKFSSQAHLWDMNPRNLKHITLQSAFGGHFHRHAIVSESTPLPQILQQARKIQQADLIVENAQGLLVGLLSLRDLAPLRKELEHSQDLLVAQDLISRPLYWVKENDTLYEAMRFLGDTDFDKVAVLENKTQGAKLLGYLRHQDILHYYYRMGLQDSSPT